MSIRGWITNLPSVQAVLRACAICPGDMWRGVDRLWVHEPIATAWATRLARWAGLVEVKDFGMLRPCYHVRLTPTGRAALAPETQARAPIGERE